MTVKNVEIEDLFLDHVVLTIGDLKKTEKFYKNIFGRPEYSDSSSIMWHFDKTKLFFCLPYNKLPKNDLFSPNRIGLDHIAVGVSSVQVLKDIESVLNSKGIKHSGIHIDKHSKKEKIWLNDPDGIRVEFFLRWTI
ncbi:MAG: VOC family protein [Candidatus Taylorbacteria bacterium]|nr:VOC family protein [Candidatus Taylorbacteria bacterium]